MPMSIVSKELLMFTNITGNIIYVAWNDPKDLFDIDTNNHKVVMLVDVSLDDHDLLCDVDSYNHEGTIYVYKYNGWCVTRWS